MTLFPLLFAFTFVSTLNAVFGEKSGKVIVGDPFTFSLTGSCAETPAKLVRNLGHKERPVAENDGKGVWKVADYYKDRAHVNSSSVYFSHTFYTDAGGYEMTCGKNLTIIQLYVVEAAEASVKLGDKVTLKCYYDTTGRQAESVSWEKNKILVIKRDFSTNQTTYGSGYKGRVSLTPRCNETGDLSLIFGKTLSEDGGDYFCSVLLRGDEKENGKPPAARLKVNEAGPDQTITITTAAPPPGRGGPGEEGAGTWNRGCIITVCVFAVLFVIASVVCIVLLSLRSRGGRGQTERPPPPHDNARPLVNGYEAESRV